MVRMCYDYLRMSTKKDRNMVSFLRELMRRRGCLPSQLAASLRVSHVTVIRWLSGRHAPSTRSCRKLAEYSGVPLVEILVIAGHLPAVSQSVPAEWPEFREYARGRYPAELDDDIITMIEDLIERRRVRRHNADDS